MPRLGWGRNRGKLTRHGAAPARRFYWVSAMSPLATAIDQLLAFVETICPSGGKYTPLLRETRARFLALDSAVWREANRARLENKMPAGTGIPEFSLGRTKFPCNAANGENINPDNLNNWKDDLQLLRELAEMAAKKTAGSQSAGSGDEVPTATLTPSVDKRETVTPFGRPAGESAAEGVQVEQDESDEAAYDPCDREPRTFREICEWVVAWHHFARPDVSGVRPPTTAQNADHHYLELFCKQDFGAFDIGALTKLRNRYILETRKTVEQTDAATLRELADHFQARHAGPRTETPATNALAGLNLFAFIRQLEHGPDDRELSDREFALLDANLARPEIVMEMQNHQSRGSRIIYGTSCAEAIGKASRILAFNRHLRGGPPMAVPPDRPAPSPSRGRLSRVDLPAIAQSVRDLYRAIDNPPGTPFIRPEWWDRVPAELNCTLPEQPAHSWLIGRAMQALQYRIQAGNLHNCRDCPEVADSDLDQRVKAKLLDLRENLCGAGRCFTSAHLANSKSTGIQFKESLLEVLRVIELGPRPPVATIHLPTVETIIRELIPAVERDHYPTISAKRDELREAIAPNPGMTDKDIRASELPGTVKRALSNLLAFIYDGPHQFQKRRLDGLDLLRATLASLAPPADPPGSGEQDGDKTDADAQVFGKWTIRPGEASYAGGPFFDVEGTVRLLLIRLAEANERTVTNERLKDACGNEQMEDETLRNHVYRLNSILKPALGLPSNPVTAADRAYRLRISHGSQSTPDPQTKTKRTSNAKRDRQ